MFFYKEMKYITWFPSVSIFQRKVSIIAGTNVDPDFSYKVFTVVGKYKNYLLILESDLQNVSSKPHP